MKSSSRKRLSRIRPEQSGYALALAVLYSFFLHAAVVGVALLLHFLVVPKTVLLPSYQVKLVGQPKESARTPVAAPAPPKKETTPETVKPSPKPKKAVVAPKKAAPKKDSMPELTRQKKTPAPVEQTKAREAAPQKPPAGPAVPAAGPATATTGKKSEGVGSITPQQDFKDSKYSWYIDTVGNLIGQNWHPPLSDSKDAKARVVFKINRSGAVIFVHLDEEHSNCSVMFKQAAMRAIWASNPFPRFSDDFFQSSLEFTVDLIPAE
jgi:outer membrane biosynthesis protein TonB